MPEYQENLLDNVLQQTGLTYSEFARRLFDYGLKESVLNEIIPLVSGQLYLERIK